MSLGLGPQQDLFDTLLGHFDREGSTTVSYVIQVWAYHGSGMQGWRTASRQAGEPYRFRTREAALEAMQTHFSNLREGVSVRVHEVEDEPGTYASGAEGSQRQ